MKSSVTARAVLAHETALALRSKGLFNATSLEGGISAWRARHPDALATPDKPEGCQTHTPPLLTQARLWMRNCSPRAVSSPFPDPEPPLAEVSHHPPVSSVFVLKASAFSRIGKTTGLHCDPS